MDEIEEELNRRISWNRDCIHVNISCNQTIVYLQTLSLHTSSTIDVLSAEWTWTLQTQWRSGRFSCNHEINPKTDKSAEKVQQPLLKLISKAPEPPISSKSTSTVSIAQKCRREQTYLINHSWVPTKEGHEKRGRQDVPDICCMRIYS